MPTLTLKAARDLLWNSASNAVLDANPAEVASVNAKLNQAIERLLTLSRPRGSLLAAQFTVVDSQVTLPRTMENVLGWKLLDDDGNETSTGGRNIYGRWFQYSAAPPMDACVCGPGLFDKGDGFVIFRELPSAGVVKLYTSTTEKGGTFHVRGLTSGLKAYTGVGQHRVEGEDLTIPSASGGSVSSATSFDAGDSIYAIVKPPTNGVLLLYHVATGGTETLIGRYEPGETIPNYRRYAYPNASDDDTDVIEVISDQAFVNAVADNDQLAISNVGALKNALKALAYEDANDVDRYGSYMTQALTLLENERQKFDGDSAVGVFQVLGDYGAGSVQNIY